MKKIVLMMLLAPVMAWGQVSSVVDSLANKDEVFTKSMLWISKTWKDAKRVIDIQDKEAGVIVIKGGLSSVPKSVGIPAEGMTKTTATIKVKDGKAKIEFSDTQFKWATGALWTTEEEARGAKKQWNKWKESVLKELDELIAEYSKAVKDDF